MQLIDKTILAQSQQHMVLAESSHVSFCDASTLALHRVDTSNGLTTPWLRAVHDGPDKVLVVDVRDLAPELRESLKGAPARDCQGIIYFALRFTYNTALLALNAVRDKCIDEIALPAQLQEAA